MKRLLLAALILSSCASTKTDGVVPYPLDTCVVTDNELGSMGDPIVKIYDGREIKFCCRPCVAEFEEEPAKFLAKLDDQAKK